MSGTGPIQNNLPVIAAQNRGAVKSAVPEAGEASATPEDSVLVGTNGWTPPSHVDETTTITVRVAVKKELLERDPATGEAPMDKLQLDLVPEERKSVNAPIFIDALEDPTPVEGYVAKSTVALVPEQLGPNTPEFQENYFAAFVPKGGYVLSQQEVDDYSQEQQQVGFQKGLSEGVEKGKKEAVPPGFQPKLMDSAAGLKIEAKRDMVSNMIGMVGSTSGALGIAAGIGIPAGVAAPLSLAVAPLQILGPTGTLSTMAKLENQKAALLESVKAENPDKDPLKVVVDMNPQTQMPITAEEALRSVDVLKKTQKMKTVGSLLLAGAGVAALAGFAPAATALAVGSLASPLADAIPTFDKIDQVRERKKELKTLLAAGQEKVEVQVPVYNDDGAPIGFKSSEIPVQEALDHVNKQQKMLALGAIGAVAQAGSLIAMGLGAPILMVVGASVALPLLARGAMFPKETWETLKELPGKVWDGIKAVAGAIGRKLGLVKESEGGSDRQAQPMSEAQKQLFDALDELKDKDPKLEASLRASLDALNKPPQSEAEQKAAIEAGVAHQEQLKEFKEQYPELATRFEGAMQAVIQEGVDEMEQAQFEQSHEAVEQAVQSEFSQSLLGSDRVKAALKDVKQDHEFGESVVRLMAQAQIFGDKSMFEQMIQTESTSVESRQQLQVYRAIEAEMQARAAAHQSAA